MLSSCPPMPAHADHRSGRRPCRDSRISSRQKRAGQAIRSSGLGRSLRGDFSNGLRALLETDEGLSLRFVVHREDAFVAVAAEKLIALVRQRVDDDATDGDVGRAVRELGGRREQPISLDNLVSGAINRLRGHTNPTPPSVYLMPESLFPANAPPPAVVRTDQPPPR